VARKGVLRRPRGDESPSDAWSKSAAVALKSVVARGWLSSDPKMALRDVGDVVEGDGPAFTVGSPASMAAKDPGKKPLDASCLDLLAAWWVRLQRLYRLLQQSHQGDHWRSVPNSPAAPGGAPAMGAMTRSRHHVSPPWGPVPGANIRVLVIADAIWRDRLGASGGIGNTSSLPQVWRLITCCRLKSCAPCQ